jgi:biopolymer transport protein ExbD
MRDPAIRQTPINAKINLTPIIDVALVLVIILLITAPMLSEIDIDVTLPEARTRGLEDEARITVTLGQGGELAVDDQVIAFESLRLMLASQLAEKQGDMLVVIRADRHTPHQIVRRVLSEASAAGATRLAIATRQKTDKSS